MHYVPLSEMKSCPFIKYLDHAMKWKVSSFFIPRDFRCWIFSIFVKGIERKIPINDCFKIDIPFYLHIFSPFLSQMIICHSKYEQKWNVDFSIYFRFVVTLLFTRISEFIWRPRVKHNNQSPICTNPVISWNAIEFIHFFEVNKFANQVVL